MNHAYEYGEMSITPSVYYHLSPHTVFLEPLFSGGQLTPSFENQGSIKIFEGQLGVTTSG